jgi:hypothetical protein
MRNDPLHDLLCRADSAIPPPPIAVRLAERVVRKARLQVIRRTGLAVIVSIIAGGLIISHSRRAHPPAPVVLTAPVNVAEIRLELAQLDADAKLHRQLATDLQNRRLRMPPTEIGIDDPDAPDPLARVDQATNRTALILLRQADRAADDPATLGRATDLYARAARLFPNTPAGRIAAQRLKRPAAST